MSDVAVLVPVSAAAVGAFLAGRQSRWNMRHDHTNKLLTDAVNDLVESILDAKSGDPGANRAYASAKNRVALHGSPGFVTALLAFDAVRETETPNGRERLLDVLILAREELGRREVRPNVLSSLFFGVTHHRDGPA